MNREEIHFIVDSLFVGNELEKGRLKLEEDRWVNLKNFKDPIVVFASQGDNITPPQQALNWIYKVYKTVDEIKRNGQVIVYIIHPRIGHLGIFVGSKIAKKEHSAIIGTVDMIEYLPPGLYEMVITDEKDDSELLERKVEFLEREMEDILKLDDGLDDEEAFGAVSAVSRVNDKMYLSFLSPVVRSMVNETTAEAIRQSHPLRMQRYMASDKNPFFWPYKYMAPWVSKNRKVVDGDNVFLKMEKDMSENIQSFLNDYREYRDNALGNSFRMLYENDIMKTLFPGQPSSDESVREEVDPLQQKLAEEMWQKTMKQGGFEAAVIRIVLLVAAADNTIDQREHLTAMKIVEDHPSLAKLSSSELKRLFKEQSSIVEHNREEAINTLVNLVRTKVEREKVFEAATAIAMADQEISKVEQVILDKVKASFKL